MELNKKLIIILNHYSHNSQSHFFHVINLLEEIAKHNVEIALIIEKCDDIPNIINPKIVVYPQKQKTKLKRVVELFRLLIKLQKQGYKRVFIRISWVAACVAIIVSFFKELKTYYWLSGTTFPNLKFGLKKIKYHLGTLLPLWFIKTFIYRFVTGPETMIEYTIKYFGVKRKKMMLLYNDIDIGRFKIVVEEDKNRLKREMGFNEEEKLLLYVKRLSPIKGTNFYFPYILDEFYRDNKNSNYRTIIVGDGSEKALLKSNISVKRYQDKISILGGIPNKDVQDFYKISDIFINCTLEEGFPRVLIEAMACGLPIVSTDAGGIKDILGRKQLEYMSEVKNLNQFSNNLIRMANLSSDELNNLKNENLEGIKKFSTTKVASMYVNSLFND
jgi:glycosyltransferase involved in cell wall biosynthesis